MPPAPKILSTVGAAAVVAVAALGLTACGSSGNLGRPTTGGTPSPGTMTSPSGGPLITDQSLSAQDRTWLTTIAQGDRFEILGGQAAESHAAGPAAHGFGQRMVTDHTANLQDLVKQAPSLNFTVPTQPNPQQQQTLTMLDRLKGARFDCSYLTNGYSTHVAAVAATKREISAGQNPRVKDMARKALPMLESHLTLARQALSGLAHCG